MKRQDILGNQAKIVFLGIGSNLGIRKRNIEKAKFLLAEHNLDVLSVSSYYETPSWPDRRKPKFLNIILKLKCYDSPQELLKICKSIENQLGRKKAKKNAPRTCDLDIIDFNNKVFNFKFNNLDFCVPHAKLIYRNFVLYPLKEVSPCWKHPKTGKLIDDLINNLKMEDKKSILKIDKS